jgi:hypothetical protein
LKNGRAFVPFELKVKLKKGMRVGKNQITSVSDNIDFDTGLYEVRVSGKASGESYARDSMNGIFIPRMAVHGGTVWIDSNSVAVSRKVVVAASDMDRVLISSGLSDGDLIIVSSVANLKDGVKVK